MQPDELTYEHLKTKISQHEAKGRGEAVAFLTWFLENILRLEPIDADDCVCDKPNDRGIDGIYVDDTLEQIVILQSKIRQTEKTIGDSALRDLAGTITQFADSHSVQALLEGGANQELKRVLERNNVKGLIDHGYKVVGTFVSNAPVDANGREFLDQAEDIVAYDRNRIAQDFVDIDVEGGIDGTYSFDTTYVEPMILRTGTKATTYLLPVRAIELIGMEGISDGSLFSQNVRQSLGNTKVNKMMRSSVLEPAEHENFPLYHNGVNILCATARRDANSLTISNYVVVNGAQSISTFYRNQKKLSPDLRVIAKIIEIRDHDLARRITINSNNQNAIKPRDLKATNEVQLRLKEEFKHVQNGEFDLEIKRGEPPVEGAVVITNEEAARLLLAFDLLEPESCHQIYKLFDEKYADVFARPAVTAYRIIFLHLLMKKITEAAPNIEYKPLSRYGLTRFFLLSVLAELLKSDDLGARCVKSPEILFEDEKLTEFLDAIEGILHGLVVDLNYEVRTRGEEFDYKGDLKSPAKIRELRGELIRGFEKEVAKGKEKGFSEVVNM